MPDLPVAAPRCEIHTFTTTDKCGCAGLPVAAPDHEAMRLRAESQCSHFHAGSGVGDTWCDRCGKPLNRWDEKCDYQLDAAHLLAEDVLALLAERQQDKAEIAEQEIALKATVEALHNALVERQQDKERIERLAAAAQSAEKTIDDYLHLGIAPSREMWYAERDALRAALAVEEDAE